MGFKVRYEETGEDRCPREGEWFRGYRGMVILARFDFTAQSFPILREVIEEDSCEAQ